MSAPYYPLDRSTRQSNVFTGNGVTKTFGPSPFKIWNATDVEIWRKLPGETSFSRFNGATITLTEDTPATFTITFPSAPPLNCKWFYKGRRLHERSTGITLANTLDRRALDAELTRLAMIQQEQYREIGQALRADPGVVAPSIVEAINDGKLLVGGPGNSVKNGPDFGEIVTLRDAALSAVGLAEHWAEVALGYKNAVDLLAQTVLQAANLTESVLPTVKSFTANGVLTQFDLGNPEIDERATYVHISGVYQQKDTYSIVDGILTFTDPPPAGNIEVVIIGSVAVSYAITQPPAGAVFIEIVDAFPPIANFEGRTVYHKPTKGLWSYTDGEWKEQGGSFELPENAIVIEPVASPPITGNFVGRTIFLTTDNKVYTFDGQDFVSIAEGAFELPEGASLIERLAGLPITDNYDGRFVFNLADGKLYVYRNNAWGSVGSGGGVIGPLPDGAGFIWSYDTLPEEGLYEGQLAVWNSNGRLYIWKDGAWKPVVDAVDVNFPDGFTGVQSVPVLPTTDNFEGRIVYLETDGKLYRYHNDAWTNEVDADDLIGQITSVQITDNAITSPKILAGAITAGKIAANAVTADAILAGAINAAKIAAGAITTDKLGALAVTADKVAAGAITAAKINVTSLAAMSAVLGNVDISAANIGSLQVGTLNIAGNAVTVQAGAETAGSLSISGAGFNLAQSVSITWGTAALFVFCQFRCTTNEDLELDIRNGGTSLLSSPISLRAPTDAINVCFDLFASGVVSGSGSIGFWLKKTTAGTISIRNRKIAVLAAKR